MKLFIVILLLIALGLSLPNKSSCECTPASSDESTRSGGNEWVAYKEEGIYQKIQGKVEMPFPELEEDVLIEVFDHPGYLICEWKDKNPNNCTMMPPNEQRRVDACKTGKDGKFCFENVPAGNYELRVSKGSGWSPTHVYVVIDPDNPDGIKKLIKVRVNLGF